VYEISSIFKDGQRSERHGGFELGPVFAWDARIGKVDARRVQKDASDFGSTGTVKVDEFRRGVDIDTERRRRYFDSVSE
jgi:hypothetical protein